MKLPGTTRTLWNILREIDLNTIQASANKPVRLVLTGDDDLAKQAASILGAAPWVSILHDTNDSSLADVIVRFSREEVPAARLGNAVDVVVSAREGLNIPDVVWLKEISEASLAASLAAPVMARTPDDLRLSLARHVPLLRSSYAALLIDEVSQSNAVYAASAGVAQIVPILSIPLSVADMVVLTKNQLIMAYRLALAEGKTGKPLDVMGEVISVVGGGFFFRQVARELVGLIPVWGIIPKIVVSYAGTWVIGQTVHAWAAKGQTATVKQMRQYYQEALDKGRVIADNLKTQLKNTQGFRLKKPRGRTPKAEPDTSAPVESSTRVLE